MLQSEQLDTRLVLAADDQMAAGLLIQRMPAEGPGARVRRAQRRPDRPQRGLQPYRPPGGHADARGTADAGCRHVAAPPVLGRAPAAFRAATAALRLQLRARARRAACCAVWARDEVDSSSPSAATSRSAASSAASSTGSTPSTWASCSPRCATSRPRRRRLMHEVLLSRAQRRGSRGARSHSGRRSVRTPRSPAGDALRCCSRGTVRRAALAAAQQRPPRPAQPRPGPGRPDHRIPAAAARAAGRAQQVVDRLAHMRRRRAAGRRPPRAGRARSAA